MARNGDIIDRAGKEQRNYNQNIRENVGALGKFQMEQLQELISMRKLSICFKLRLISLDFQNE